MFKKKTVCILCSVAKVNEHAKCFTICFANWRQDVSLGQIRPPKTLFAVSEAAEQQKKAVTLLSLQVVWHAWL